MRTSRANHVGFAVALPLAVLTHFAMAQTPAPAQTDGQAPATVVVTASRPVNLDGYQAVESRIETILSHQPALSSPFLSRCMEDRFAVENAAVPGRSLPLQDSASTEYHIKCARVHIEAKDTTLRQGLQAFDRQDYAAALGLFKQAYAKMGTQDAALMLAKMQFGGLGTPKDKAKGIAWLREVAEDRFDPRRDALRFDPAHPAATNARIDAAMMLARIYEEGDGVARDGKQAERWYAKAVEFGFVPVLDSLGGAAYGLGKPLVAHQPAKEAPGDGVPLPSQATVAAVASLPDEQALATVAAAPARDTPARPEPHADKVGPGEGGARLQDQADPGVLMRVHVTGVRALPWKSYRAMRAAVAAYEEHKALAPDAAFSFAAIAPPGTRLPANFKLRVRTREGQEYPIALEAGALFQLPVLPDPQVDADLVSNLKGGALRIGLLVHTRSVPPEKERLGDVRLREAIGQAIADVDHPSDDPRCRGRRRGHNDCRLPRATVWFKPRAPASGAWLVVGDRREALQGNGDPDYPAYRMPVGAGHLGNDVVIEFDYKLPLRPVKLDAVLMSDAND